MPVELLLLQRQLRWLGHVIRMPSNRLPCKILYGLHTVLGQLIGQWIKGGQNKRFKDHIKARLKKCSIPFSLPEALAAHRDTWRSTCENGLATFLAASGQATDRTVTQEDMLPPNPCRRTPLSYLQQNLCLRILTSESPPQSLTTSSSVAQNVVVDIDGLQQGNANLR